MSKHTDKLKRQLLEISEVVNSFQSEAVQLRIIDKLLDALIESDGEGFEHFTRKAPKADTGEEIPSTPAKKKPGATKILYQLLGSDFFIEARSISSIAEYCKDNFDTEFKTSELSGILLKLSNENKLIRQRNQDNNRFEYIKS